MWKMKKSKLLDMGKICNKYHQMEGMCVNCPLHKDGDTAYDCYTSWSQMSYMKEEKQ